MRSSGRYCEGSDIRDARGTRKATDFLRLTTRQFAKRSLTFYEETNFWPFSYRERQTHSVLLPAASDIASGVLFEQPINRRWGRGASAGFLDYLVFHRKIMLLMEVKQAWVSVRTGKPSRSLIAGWRSAMRQIDRVETHDIKDEYRVYYNRVFRIAMMVAPYWRSGRRAEFDELPESLLTTRLENIMDWLHPTPNWAAFWSLPPELQVKKFHGEERHFEQYPGVAFLCHVHVRG